MPFLRNVTAGRGVPDERLAEVAEQYALFGGRSPINDQCRALLAALRNELSNSNNESINKLPVYWGNRNWHPFLDETVQQMAKDGIKRAAVFVTSAFGSYSGCRQYRENLIDSAANVDGSPQLQKLRLFYNHPGFIEPLAENLRNALASHPAPAQVDTRRIIFTAHSIPLSMADACDYGSQLIAGAQLVLDAANVDDQAPEVVFQSRSGPPHMPWLEPDINDHLRDLKAEGVDAVAVVPLGFVSDHMEVMFDLDTQAAATATELSIDYVRVPTVGTAPAFVSMIRQLVEELSDEAPKLWLGNDGPWPDVCPDGHCAPPQRPSR